MFTTFALTDQHRANQPDTAACSRQCDPRANTSWGKVHSCKNRKRQAKCRKQTKRGTEEEKERKTRKSM